LRYIPHEVDQRFSLPGFPAHPKFSVSSGAGGFSSFSSSSLTPQNDTRHPAKDADPERPSEPKGSCLCFSFVLAISFRMNTYKNVPITPQNQHLWRKGLKVPLFSTLTKNRGRGGYRSSRPLCFTLPRTALNEPLFQPLAHSLHTLLRIATTHLLFFQWFAHSLLKHGGVPQLFFTPKAFFEGPNRNSSLSSLPPIFLLSSVDSVLCGDCLFLFCLSPN